MRLFSSMSQTPHGGQSVLLKDGRQVGLGHIIGEGAVAENDGGFASGFQFFVPGYYAESQRFDVCMRDVGRETNEQ